METNNVTTDQHYIMLGSEQPIRLRYFTRGNNNKKCIPVINVGQDLHVDLILHNTKTVAVNLLLPSKVLLEKFRVMISESRMFQENDC